MKRCRLIVTLDCPRHCHYCCNKHQTTKDSMITRSLIQVMAKGYDEIIITGGEPLLDWERTSYIIKNLRISFRPRIYLYTSMVIDEMADVLAKTDGITFSLHKPLMHHELRAFKQLQTLVDFYFDKSCYLNIEQGITMDIPITPSAWERVVTFKPLPDGQCLAPEDDLIILED